MKYLKAYESKFTQKKDIPPIEGVFPVSVISEILGKLENGVGKDYIVEEKSFTDDDPCFLYPVGLGSIDIKKVYDKRQFIVKDRDENVKNEDYRLILNITIYIPSTGVVSVDHPRRGDVAYNSVGLSIYINDKKSNIGWKRIVSTSYKTYDGLSNTIINHVVRISNTHRKEVRKKIAAEEFYKRVSPEEIKDLMSDISDEIGPCDVSKTNNQLGFSVRFDLPKSIELNNSSVIINDDIVNLFTNLNNLKKRLKSGYNLQMGVAFPYITEDWDDDGDPIQGNRWLNIRIFQ